VFYPENGGCAAFLSNYDTQSAAKVLFNNMHYNLPRWSISILPDCRNVAFNTAKVCLPQHHKNYLEIYVADRIIFFSLSVLTSSEMITGGSADITHGNAANWCSNIPMGELQ